MSHSLMQQSKLLAKIQKGGGTLQRRELYNRNEYRIGVYRGNIAGYPPLYYLYLLPFYLLSVPLTSYWSLIFLRIGSLCLGLLSIMLIYKIVQLLFPRSTLIPLLTVVFVVLDPMFTFMTAVVNNDNMVLLSFLLFLYLALRLVVLEKKVATKNVILVGLVAGLSTL